jgi:hypothetical protein
MEKSKDTSIIVAIPSHERATVLTTRTLQLLSEAQIPWRVDVWLSNKDQLAEYAESVKVAGLGLEVRFVVPPTPLITLTDKVNAIVSGYPPGQKVLFMEDDMRKFVTKDGSKVVPAEREFVSAVREGFGFAQLSKVPMWGVAASANGFYMDERNSTSLKLIVAYMFGFVALEKSKCLHVTLPLKTDYERTCRVFKKYGACPRLNRYALMTDSYKTAGGLQSLQDKRLAMEEASVEAIVSQYPKLITRNEKRATMFPELRFLRQSKASA